ncbi:hypothetical protein H2200_005641 [Cladophialophora chaetospira]|uniref:F-box domain-containing protein n=1 Tax=Cladophialophora chaetospira TaxID=386627 RepID=A0AA38XD15_9EURO|nr:hypothetical protein H2200_005641 [Cladophialophora chaetospira]
MHAATSTSFCPRVLSSLLANRPEKETCLPSTPTCAEDEDSETGKTTCNDNKHLDSLPPELHHMIAAHLIYPDLLSWKLTNKYFSTLLAPKLNVKIRVDWVQSRHAQYLPVPISTKLSFKSDALFVGNVEVNSILRRRRRHSECIEYDKDHRKAFKNPILALELDGHGRMQYIQARARIRPSWSKACLITGEPVCSRIEEMELAKQQFENSFVGRACASWRAATWAAWCAWQWLKGVWDLNTLSLRRRYFG